MSFPIVDLDLGVHSQMSALEGVLHVTAHTKTPTKNVTKGMAGV